MMMRFGVFLMIFAGTGFSFPNEDELCVRDYGEQILNPCDENLTNYFEVDYGNNRVACVAKYEAKKCEVYDGGFGWVDTREGVLICTADYHDKVDESNLCKLMPKRYVYVPGAKPENELDGRE